MSRCFLIALALHCVSEFVVVDPSVRGNRCSRSNRRRVQFSSVQTNSTIQTSNVSSPKLRIIVESRQLVYVSTVKLQWVLEP